MTQDDRRNGITIKSGNEETPKNVIRGPHFITEYGPPGPYSI